MTAFVSAAWEVVRLQGLLIDALSAGRAADPEVVERLQRALAAMRASHPS